MNRILRYPTHYCQACLQKLAVKKGIPCKQKYFNVRAMDKYLTAEENKNQNYVMMIDDNLLL
jgi:hypothetical protein